MNEDDIEFLTGWTRDGINEYATMEERKELLDKVNRIEKELIEMMEDD